MKKFTQKDFEILTTKLANAINGDAVISVAFRKEKSKKIKMQYLVFYNDSMKSFYNLNDMVKHVNDIINESTNQGKQNDN